MPSNTSTKSKKVKSIKNAKSIASTRSTRSNSGDSTNTIDEQFPEIQQVQVEVHSTGDGKSVRQPGVQGKKESSHSDSDSDGDSDEFPGPEGPIISTGHGVSPLRYHLKLVDRPSLKSDKQSWTQFNGGLIYYASKFTYGRVNLESKKMTWCNEDDIELFEIIRRCIQIDKIWKLIEVIPHGKGFQAYQALQLHYEGDKKRQHRSAMKNAVSIRMGERETAEEYMIRVLKTEKDAVDHEIYKLQSNGACPVVITQSLDTLPQRFQHWAIARRHMYDNNGYPPTRDYLEDLVAYEENEKSQDRMVLPINAFNNETN